MAENADCEQARRAHRELANGYAARIGEAVLNGTWRLTLSQKNFAIKRRLVADSPDERARPAGRQRSRLSQSNSMTMRGG